MNESVSLKSRHASALPKLGDFDITCPDGWTVTHCLDKDGRHVIRSTRTVTRAEYIARGGFVLCDTPQPPVLGFVRSYDVQEDIYKKHWDVLVTDREIPRGSQ